MKGWVGWILLGLSLVVAYQGFENSRQDPKVETLAGQVACDVDPGCVLASERPHTIRTDVVQHRYAWNSSIGPVHVVCRREFVFFGAWNCSPRLGSLGNV
jgi:hypothetical protein